MDIVMNRKSSVGKSMARSIKAPPKVKIKETKSEKRMFRFTPSNRKQLDDLNTRWGGGEDDKASCDISKVMDILVEASKKPEVLQLLDRYVSETYS